MMLNDDEVNSAATALVEAESNKTQTGLVSVRFPEMDMDDAYKIQDRVIALHIANGRKQIGWKIGLTSKAMQRVLNIDIPDSGVLFDDMLFENNSTIPAGKFIEPRVETEIAFVMKSDVDEMSREAIIAATDFVAPSLEILDTRIFRADPDSGRTRNIFDTIADNAANAGIVLGDKKNKVNDHDLRRVGAILKCNGVVEETGLGAAVLDDPVTSMLWLAERLKQYGQKISAGDIVLSGSFIRFTEAPPGSQIDADFGTFGKVGLSFA